MPKENCHRRRRNNSQEEDKNDCISRKFSWKCEWVRIDFKINLNHTNINQTPCTNMKNISFSETDPKLLTTVKKEAESKPGELDTILNTGNGILPFLNSGSAMLNSSLLNQLQPTTPISIFKGSPELASPSSPITSSSISLPQIIKPPVVGFGLEGSISSPISTNVLSSFSSGVSAQSAPVTGQLQSTSLPLLTPSSQVTSNFLQENNLKNNVSNIQAAILAASRLIAVPTGSIPSTPMLSLASSLTTSAPSLTVGKGLTTYLNPNLISELLLAGGNLKGASLNIGGIGNTGIIHHELPENTTIYPVSDASKTTNDMQNSASLSESQKSAAMSSLSLASLLPNSGTTTIGSVPLGILGVPSTLQGSNLTTPMSISPTKSVQTTHQTVKDGVLPDSTIAELSAATGLPSADIAAWAAKLPSGSTVKVTRHFDTTLAGMKNKLPPSSTIEVPTASMFPIKLPNNISITATQSLIPPPPKLIAAPSRTSIASMPSSTNIAIPSITSASQQLPINGSPPTLPHYANPNGPTNGILTEYLTNFRTSHSNSNPLEPSINLLRTPTSLLQHIQIPTASNYISEANMTPSNSSSSNISFEQPLCNESSFLENKITPNENAGNQIGESQLLTSGAICLGLPSYQESFAVDPNEVLSRSSHDNLITSNPNPTNSLTSPSALEMSLSQRKRPHGQCLLDQNEPRPKVADFESSYHDVHSNSSINNPLTFANDNVDEKIDANSLLLENGGTNAFSSMETKIHIPR